MNLKFYSDKSQNKKKYDFYCDDYKKGFDLSEVEKTKISASMTTGFSIYICPYCGSLKIPDA